MLKVVYVIIAMKQEIIIVKEFYENDMDAIGALNALVKEAFNRWKNMEDSIDDITAIVIFFE